MPRFSHHHLRAGDEGEPGAGDSNPCHAERGNAQQRVNLVFYETRGLELYEETCS